MVLLQAAPSWDLVITLFFVIGITYGFVMLRDRIIVTLLSLYAATVVANTLSEPIVKFFNGDVTLLNKVWVESSASPFFIKLFLFGAVILLIGAKSGLRGTRSGFSFFELGAYSFFTVAIALSSVFTFMDPAKLAGFTASSKLVSLLVQHHNLWLIAPLLVLLILGATGRGGGRNADDY